MTTFNRTRRRVLSAAGATTLDAVFGGTMLGRSRTAGAQSVKTNRWGIVGTEGVINIDDFVGQNRDGSAEFLYRKGGWGGGASGEINIPRLNPALH